MKPLTNLISSLFLIAGVVPQTDVPYQQPFAQNCPGGVCPVPVYQPRFARPVVIQQPRQRVIQPRQRVILQSASAPLTTSQPPATTTSIRMTGYETRMENRTRTVCQEITEQVPVQVPKYVRTVTRMQAVEEEVPVTVKKVRMRTETRTYEVQVPEEYEEVVMQRRTRYVPVITEEPVDAATVAPAPVQAYCPPQPQVVAQCNPVAQTGVTVYSEPVQQAVTYCQPAESFVQAADCPDCSGQVQTFDQTQYAQPSVLGRQRIFGRAPLRTIFRNTFKRLRRR